MRENQVEQAVKMQQMATQGQSPSTSTDNYASGSASVRMASSRCNSSRRRSDYN